MILLPFGYHNPYSFVPFRYQRILLTTIICDSFGAAWNLATCPTACITSGREAVTYRRLPIIDLYNLWSISLDESSMLNLQPVTIGVRMGLQSSIINLLRISLMYLAWHINIPFSCWDIWSPKKYVSSPSKDISKSFAPL